MYKLRKINIEDLGLIMQWRMSEDVSKYMYTSPTLTLDKQLEWFKSINNNPSMKHWIITIEDNLPVGVLSLTNIDFNHEKASWAYYLGDINARGKGLARILECNIYDYVFETLKLNKLCCEVFEFNKHVITLHQKFGAIIEGTLIDHIKKDGEFYNVVLMGIRKENWLKIKNNISYSHLDIEPI